ncbi:autotransporter-associated beta strand repeat-containing protein, partial [Candidatus Pelagibacter bacterium]|nr:autotransporter-associated beta strand repeat-containing protein [Candidatus Pelagibacter bacterium]
TTINAAFVEIKQNSTYDITNSSVYIIDAPIRSSFSITKTGNGTLVFNDTDRSNFFSDIIITNGTVAASNNNTLGTGTVRLNGGTLSSDSTGARSLDNAISVQVSSELGNATNSGTLTLSGNLDFTAGDLTLSSRSDNVISGTVNLFNSNQTFSIDSSVTQTLSGDVSNGALNKSGSGILLLSGTNTYTGDTNISAGTLNVSGLLNSGTYSGKIDNSGTFTFSSNSDQTLSGDIEGPGTLTKSGLSTLTLSGTNIYSGTTTISDGTLTLSGTGSLSVNTAVTVESGASFNVDASNTVGSITGAGTIDIADKEVLTVGGDNSSTIFSGIIQSGDGTGTGAIIKVGTGSLTLSGNNNFGGAVNVNAGSLIVSSNNALGNTTNLTTVGSEGTIDFQNVNYSTIELLYNSGTIATSTGTSTFAGDVQLFANSIVDVDGTQLTLSGNITDSGARNLTKEGTGILVLSGTNNYSGDTLISAGTLKLTGSLSNLTDVTINSGASLDLQSSQTIASLNLDGSITRSAGTSTLTVSGTSDLGGNVTTSSSQTYTGATTLSAANTLTTTNSNITFSNTVNSDGTTRNLTINAGTGTTQFAGIVGGSSGVGDIDITGALDLNAAIANAASLSVSGTSNIGANVTTTGTQSYSGTTTLSGGDRTLQGSTVTLAAVTGGSNALTVTGNLDLDGAISRVTNMSVSGTSNIGSNVTTTGTQNYQGTTTLSGGDRTLQGSTITMAAVTGTGLHDLIITGNLDLDGAVTNVVELDITGTSNIGANVTTTGTQNFQGTTTLSGGDRTLTASTVTLNAVTGGSNALTITGNLDLDGAISGVTNMSVSGTSNIGADVTTTGTQSYTGTTTVSASSTLIGTEISAAVIALNDDLEIRNSSDSTLASVISGTGALTKSGSGALTLRGVNTFDGDLTVSAGTLYAGLAADSGNQVIENNVTVSGGTLSGGATIGGNVTVATANLAPGNSIGTLTIDGNVTLGDNSTTTIEFNDTTSDQVVVSGNITLAGALVLEPANTTYSDATFTIFDGSGGSGNSLSGTFASTTVSNSSYLGDATTSISYDTVNRKVFLNIDEDGGVSSNTVKSLTTRNKFKDIAQIFDDATAGKILEVANVLKSSDSNSVNTELNKTKGTLLANSSLKSVSNHQFYQKALDNIVSANTNSSVSNFTQNNLADLTLDNLQSEGLYGEKSSYNDYYDFSDQSVLGFIKNNKNRTLLSKFSSEDRSSFLRTYGTSSDNENIGADYTGYKSDTYGVLFGQQFKDNDKDFYGYAYGFSGTDIDYNNDYGETNAYTLHTSVFKQVSDDDYNLNLKLGGYLTNRQNERKVSIFGTSVNDTYKSETTDLGLQAGATYLKKYNILGLNLSPSISLSSTYEFKDDIDEEGGSLALKVDNENLLTIKPEIGFSLDKNFSTIENITNQFSFAMFASEDHYLEGTTASAKFATGSNFNLDLPRDKDQFLAAGLGYNFLNSESGTSLMANLFYTQNTENDYEGNLFSLTFRKLFGDFGRGRIPAVITEKVDEQKEKVVKIILPKVEKEEETIVDTVRRSLALLFQKEATSYRAYKDIYENFDCKVLEDVRLYQSLMYLSRPQVVNLLEKCDIEDQNTIALVANRLNDIRLNDLTMFEILKKNYYYSLIYLPFITFIAFVILMYELSKKGYFKLRRKP